MCCLPATNHAVLVIINKKKVIITAIINSLFICLYRKRMIMSLGKNTVGLWTLLLFMQSEHNNLCTSHTSSSLRFTSKSPTGEVYHCDAEYINIYTCMCCLPATNHAVLVIINLKKVIITAIINSLFICLYRKRMIMSLGKNTVGLWTLLLFMQSEHNNLCTSHTSSSLRFTSKSPTGEVYHCDAE